MSSHAQRSIEVQVRYAGVAEEAPGEDRLHLRIPTDGIRSSSRLQATLNRPGVMRDALLTLGDVLSSDLRFKARDRSEYLAWLLKQGKGVTKEVWEAQKAFLEAKYGEAVREELPLDPVLTVDEDGFAIEVFSADESAYARLQVKAGEAYREEGRQSGTTYLELSAPLLKSLSRLRSYRPTTLEFTPSQEGTPKTFKVPHRWIRAFSQVQAASTLPATTFQIAPVDLYNVLFTLRSQKAKKGPRALRYELSPGEAPRLVLEPWDLVLQGTGGTYQGMRPQVVRTWGRNRLMVLSRLLPHTKSITVHLVGAGLPAYYVIDLGDATLTLALSGWTDSGWAGISTIDLMAAGKGDDLLPHQLLKRLEGGPQSLEALVEATRREPHTVRQALLLQMQQGLVMHDVATGTFRYRPLFPEPLDAAALRYRDEREEEANRLLEVEGQVRLTRVHDLGAEGVRIEGEVEDRRAHRTYRTSFTLDREGRTVDATCSSPQFRRSGLKEGPTVPMIALRLLYAREQARLEQARGTEEGRRLIRAETRTLLKRTEGQALLYRVSLDDRQVVVRWGTHPDRMRVQRMLFPSGEEARIEYFGRLEQLGDKGFMDMSQAERV